MYYGISTSRYQGPPAPCSVCDGKLVTAEFPAASNRYTKSEDRSFWVPAGVSSELDATSKSFLRRLFPQSPL